ncbi:hypothetical protein D1007_41557 [Hordeum vulgare]|nr:hypothetical protein D1007_41557 [Hordeum vulgare]
MGLGDRAGEALWDEPLEGGVWFHLAGLGFLVAVALFLGGLGSMYSSDHASLGYLGDAFHRPACKKGHNLMLVDKLSGRNRISSWVTTSIGGWLLYIDTDGNFVDSFHRNGQYLHAWQRRLKQTLVPHTFFAALDGYVVNDFPFT